MGGQRRMEKNNKSLGTERCANIDTLYTNKTFPEKFVGKIDSFLIPTF